MSQVAPPIITQVPMGGPLIELGGPPAYLVDHDGRLYPLDTLLRQVPPARALELQDEMPRSGQAAWDLVCRRWPIMADAIAAVVRPVDGLAVSAIG